MAVPEVHANKIIDVQVVETLTNSQKLNQNLWAAYRQRGRRFW